MRRAVHSYLEQTLHTNISLSTPNPTRKKKEQLTKHFTRNVCFKTSTDILKEILFYICWKEILLTDMYVSIKDISSDNSIYVVASVVIQGFK